MQKDCPNWLASWLILLLASMCTVAPLAFLDISEGQWIEGARGAMVVNENLKFAAFLFLGCLPVGSVCLALSNGWISWSLPRGILLPASLLLIACIVSSVRAVDSGRHWMTAWQVFILPLSLFIGVGCLKWKTVFVVRLVLALLPAGVLVAVMGLDQFYKWPWVSLGDVLPHYQLGSMLYSQNLAAEYLSLLIPLAFACVFLRLGKWRWLCFLAGGVILFFFILTRARAAWVGLLGGSILAGVIVIWVLISHESSEVVSSVRRRVILMSIGLAGGFLVLLFLSPYWATGLGDDPPGPNEPLQSNRFILEFKSIFEGQSNGRRQIWNDSFQMGREAGGFWGLGAGQFRIHFPRFIDASHEMFVDSLNGPMFKQTRRAHNDYLQLLVELGVLGFVAALWLWIRVIFGAINSIKESLDAGDIQKLLLLFGLLASVLTLSVAMFFDFPSRMPATIAIGWTCLGLLVGLEPRQSSSSQFQGDGRSLLVLVALFTIAMSWSLGWRTLKGDFFRVQGSLALGVGDYANARSYYQVARRCQPWEDDPWLKLYWLFRQDSNMEGALNVVQGHLARNPWYYLPMKYEKECYMHLGRWEDARNSVERILDLYPRHPDAFRLKNEVGIYVN